MIARARVADDRRAYSYMRRAVLAGLLVTIIGAAPEAQAAWTNSFNLGGPVPGYAGSGAARGDLLYEASNARVFRVGGEIRDNCPEDGKGMELMVRVRRANGEVFVQGNVMQDLNGCGTAWVVVNPPLGFTAPWAISESRTQLYATEAGAPFVQIDQSTWKARP